jgi:CelD/BcsL family acetyltransferase involved in cellulose biosynthesis
MKRTVQYCFREESQKYSEGISSHINYHNGSISHNHKVDIRKKIQTIRFQTGLMEQSIPLQTTQIQSPSDLGPYLGAWRELTAGAPMRSPDWLLSWWEIYSMPGEELCILLFQEPGGTLIGLAPLYLQCAGSKGIFRLLGAGGVGTNHTTWFSISGWEKRVGIEVARFLLQCKSKWTRLLLEFVDADDEAIYATMQHFVENGCFHRLRPLPSCWKIALPASWDEYLAMLSRSLRKRCRKLQRQFFDSGLIKIRQVKSEADLQEGFEILLQLHAARWGSDEKPRGVFEDQRFRTFHQTVSRKLLTRGQLRLAWLEYAGKPLAVEYQFVDSKTVYAYQAGIDLSMNAYSPGKLSMMAAIQFALARGCKTFDLLRGNEPYKANWRATSVACHDLHVWQNGLIGRLEWAMWGMYKLAARLLRPILPSRLLDLGFRLFQALGEACSTLRRKS